MSTPRRVSPPRRVTSTWMRGPSPSASCAAAATRASPRRLTVATTASRRGIVRRGRRRRERGGERGGAGGGGASRQQLQHQPTSPNLLLLHLRPRLQDSQVALHALRDAQLNARGPRLQWAHQVRVLRSDLLIPNKLPDGSGSNGTSMFFNHLSSRNDPLHQAIPRRRSRRRPSAPDAIAKALEHAGTPEKEKSG